jgi:hypothetical protein
MPELRLPLDDRPGDGHAQHHVQRLRIEPAQARLKSSVSA